MGLLESTHKSDYSKVPNAGECRSDFYEVLTNGVRRHHRPDVRRRHHRRRRLFSVELR